MLLINHARDRRFRATSDFVDEETERREAEARGMLDQTEIENKAFRYVL